MISPHSRASIQRSNLVRFVRQLSISRERLIDRVCESAHFASVSGSWATRTLLKFSVGLDKFHHLGQRTIPAPALNIRAVIAPHSAHPCSMSSRFFAPTRVSSSFHREFFRSNFAGNFSLCVHNELCISKPGTMKRIPALHSTHCLATPLVRGIYSYLQSEEGVADRVCLQTDEYRELRHRVWGNRGTRP
jgi:hypothetical protein